MHPTTETLWASPATEEWRGARQSEPGKCFAENSGTEMGAAAKSPITGNAQSDSCKLLWLRRMFYIVAP
jgi:hypothetical protein